MAFPIEPPIQPMLSAPKDEIPRGDGWLYEPKWDGFRAIVFRDGENVHIGSRNSLPLERYFPEVVSTCVEALPARCVVDGEIVLPSDNGLDFSSLQLRLHPAASRVKKLSLEIPASLVVFDMLADSHDIRGKPFAERRAALVASILASDRCFVTPQTADPAVAEDWFEQFEGAGLDGVIAKRAEQPYAEGERVMVKVKHRRTADCVVVGYRYGKDGKSLGSLLLGMYEGETLHHVGHTSTFKAAEKKLVLELLQPLVIESMESDGRLPGGPSRWTGDRDLSWVAVKPALVCEVGFDHMQDGYRFRHGAKFLRWREDKDATDCTFEQLQPPRAFSLDEIRALA